MDTSDEYKEDRGRPPFAIVPGIGRTGWITVYEPSSSKKDPKKQASNNNSRITRLQSKSISKMFDLFSLVRKKWGGEIDEEQTTRGFSDIMNYAGPACNKIKMEKMPNANNNNYHYHPEEIQIFKPSSEDNNNSSWNRVMKRRVADAANLPEKFLCLVASHLDYKSLLQMRLICSQWNKIVVGSNAFQDRSVLCLTELSHIIECSKNNYQVKWFHIRVNNNTTPWNITASLASGYQKAYLYHKLRKELPGLGTKLLSNITSLILQEVEINKDSLLKWLTSPTAKNLTSLHLHDCTFPKSKISYWSPEVLRNSLLKLRTFKATGISQEDIFEACRFFLLYSGSLMHIQLRQEGSKKPMMYHFPHAVQRGTGRIQEKEVLNSLFEAIINNAKSQESLDLTLEQFRSPIAISDFFIKMGDFSRSFCSLRKLEFKIVEAETRKIIVDPKQIFGRSGVVQPVLEKFIKNCNLLECIHIPFMFVFTEKIIDAEANASSILSALPHLRDLGAQFLRSPSKDDETELVEAMGTNNFTSPTVRPFSVDGKKGLQNLSNVTSYGDWRRGFEGFAEMKKMFPSMKSLSIDTGNSTEGVSTQEFQQILRFLPTLEKLDVRFVTGFRDIGLTGVEPSTMKILKDKFRVRGRSGSNSSTPDSEGLPISHMQNLRIFRIRGDMHISDVGVMSGFSRPMKQLEILEMSGSDLHLSSNGLTSLVKNCPNLRELTMSLDTEIAKALDLDEILTRLPMLRKNGNNVITIMTTSC